MQAIEAFHFHRDVEIYFVHEGVGHVILDQQIHEVKAGTLLLFRPYQPHYLQMEISAIQPFVSSFVRYNLNYFNSYLKNFPNLEEFHRSLLHSHTLLQIQQLLEPDPLIHFIRDYKQCFNSPPKRDDPERNAVFLLAFFSFIQPLWETYRDPKPHNTTTHTFIIDVLQWIDQNYAQAFHLEALASYVHLSPNHVSSLFQKVTGKTITDFLIVRRLKQASLLLLTTSLSIQAVGEQSGYANFPYFCQAIKKHMGMTPAQFRLQG